MRRHAALLSAALALLLTAGCSQRERANPFDPRNPQTGGRPTGFNAVAGLSVVQLSWDKRSDLAIDGFQLYRRTSSDSLWRPLGALLPPEAGQYLDSAVRNGERIRYRLVFVAHGQPVGGPAEDEATPGPLRPWIADPGAGAVLRLSPDGRDVTIRETRFGAAGRIAVDSFDGFLWASSNTTGLVWASDPGSPFPISIPGISSPDAIAIHPFDHSAWVCDRAGAVFHFRRDGSVPSPGRITPLDDPVAIATCALDASLWVCERGGNRVRHFSALGVPLGAAFVRAPTRIAVDSLTRVAYVTSFELGRLWRIAENGTPIDSSAAAIAPIGIAIDRPRGRVWVADDGGARLLGLSLETLAVEVTVTNAGIPYDVAVDRSSGEVWVVARSDGAVVRLAPDGRRLDVRTGFTDPVEVRLDPGQ
ncbi:MAG: hypothetical protein IT347_05500 [Candidatus Eisenbacteria bacterium]|nr:hypothetical protein [Candidatus Eisenbacteria bacterium]